MSNKIEKVISDIEKIETKIAELQKELEALRDRKTELENIEIVKAVRAMQMGKDDILAFVKSLKAFQPKPMKSAVPNKSEAETEVNDHE